MAAVADDFDFIRRRVRAIAGEREGRCEIRASGIAQDCWCWKSGPDGETLRCPPPPQEEQQRDTQFGRLMDLTPIPWFAGR